MGRRHHTDRATRLDAPTDCLDDVHGCKRVGDHHLAEDVRGDPAHGLVGVGDAGADEQQVEACVVEPAAKSLDAGVVGDVQLLDLDTPAVGIGDFVQFGLSITAYRSGHVPTASRELMHETCSDGAGRSDDECIPLRPHIVHFV